VNAPEVTRPPAPSSPRGRRGCFGLALKTTLGCAAAALGAFVVLVLLLPTMLGGFARSTAEGIFAEGFRGTLKVREVDLAWNGPQKITEAVLLDPEQREVARVTAVLPSLLDLIGSTGPLRLRVEVDADLVADDQGLVNLQRAIEPRAPKPKESADRGGDEAGSNGLETISSLDAEVEVVSRRLSWSDAETRRSGKPFEVRDLSVKVLAKPGQPLTVRATGQIVADAPGALEAEAVLHGPIESGKAWPFGDVDAKVRIEGFSTAMVDGIAGLGGKLTEVLGPRFDFRLAASGMTPQKGAIEVALASPHSSFDFAGTFEGGLLRSRDGSPVKLALGVPRGFVDDRIAPSLPPGISLRWEESDQPWTVSVTNLELPIPDASAPDVPGLARSFEHLRCDVDVDLPSHVGFESAETRAAKVRVALDGVRIRLGVAPGEPARARLETTLDTGTTGRITAEAVVAEPWKALAEGGIPPADLALDVVGVHTPAIDALAGQGGRLAEAIGPSLAVHLKADDFSASSSGSLRAEVDTPRLKVGLGGSIESGALRGSGEAGLDVSWDPPAGFVDRHLAASLPSGTNLAVQAGRVEIRGREMTVPIAAPSTEELLKALALDLSLRLPAAKWTPEGDGTSTQGLAPIVIDATSVDVKIVSGGDLVIGVRSSLDGGANGRISLDAHVPELSRVLASDSLPPVEAKLSVEGLATALVDGLAGQKGLLVQALGSPLSLTGSATAKGKVVELRVGESSPTTRLELSAQLDDRTLRARGEDGLHLTARLSEELVLQQIAPALPPGATLALLDADRPIELSVRDLQFVLPPPSAAEVPLVARLEPLAGKVGLRVGGLRYADEHTRAAKVDLSLRDVELNVEIAPKQPLAARLAAVVHAGSEGKLDLKLSLADPWFSMRGEGAKLPPVDVDLRLAGLPNAALDALSGRPGLVSGLLGPTSDLAVDTKGASPEAGAFSASLGSPSASIALAARLENGVLLAADKPAIDVRATLSQAWLDQQVGALMPAGAKLTLPDQEPVLRLSVRDVKIPLPQGPATAEAFAAITMRLSASLPSLAYSDARTAAAGAPAVVRDFGLEADVAPGKPPEAKLAAKIEGEPAGELSATLRALDPLASLAAEKGLEKFRVASDVRAKSVPTGLVDVLAAQEGLLVDVLGPRLDLVLHTDAISQTDGTFTASLESEKASVRCDRGGMKDGVLFLEHVQGKNEALLARAGLTPLFSKKIVGSLVPALVNLEKPAGAEPVVLAVENLRMPLDADLSKLDAAVRLDLGEVSYRLLPALSTMLGKGEATTVKMPEIRVPIEKGVASYEGLPIRIGGRDRVFKGTFSLVDQSFRLNTQLPLSALGKGVSGKLDGLRGVLDANTMVPIELRGTWQNPKVGVGEDFLKKVAEDALKKQGGSLLEDLFKKKK